MGAVLFLSAVAFICVFGIAKVVGRLSNASAASDASIAALFIALASFVTCLALGVPL